MRLLYYWFRRIIGVGNLLDIMDLYVMMLIWIIGAMIAFFPEDVDGKKHRSAHRQGPHRHHHHRYHKHAKLHHHLPIIGNFTVKTKRISQLSPKNHNLPNIVTTRPWIFTEKSDVLLVNSSFADKEEMESLHRKISTEKISLLSNSEQMSNALKNSIRFNNYTEVNNNSESSTLNSNGNYKNASDFRNSFVSSQITIGLIEESTTQLFGQWFSSSSRSQEAKEMKKDDSEDFSNNSFNITEVENEKVPEDLKNLFGSPKNEKHSTDSFIDNNPVVELIRKKRSAVKKEREKSADGEIRIETLQDFSGPKILNDPEEIENLESPNAVHKRVKRDGSELDNDDRSALLSLDSTYLRNLEDSFPLSALEVQAQRSQMSDRRKNIARSKRGIELNAEEANINNGQFSSEINNHVSKNRVNNFRPLNRQSSIDLNQEKHSNNLRSNSEKMTLTNSLPASMDRILSNRVNDFEDLPKNAPTLNSSEEEKTTYFQIESQKTATHMSQTEANAILKNLVNTDNNLVDLYTTDLDSTNFSAESSTSANSLVKNTNLVTEDRVNVEYTAEISSNFNFEKDDISNDSAISSRTSTPTELTSKYFDPVLKNKINNFQPYQDALVLNKKKAGLIRDDDGVNGDQSTIKDVEEHPQISPSNNNSIVNDADSILRYGLDDVYPEIIQDSENLSSMVQLVRTKRFGDSIVYAEAPDASYANEIDNSRTVDEPYAKDNRIIDSMLSKIEYRNVDEQDAGSDNESPFSEDEIDADKQNYNKREEVAIRGKRGKSSKKSRKNNGKNRRSYGKQKKSHKGKGKKHDSKRCKKNRASKNLWKREFDIDDSLADIKRVDGDDQLSDNKEDFILADGRRQRKSEDDNEENLYSDSIETAGRVRRDIRKNSEAKSDNNISPNSIVHMKAQIRDKRKSAPEVEKKLENVGEANVGQNRNEETTDMQKADVPIQDIRKLAAELLNKVDELLGYATENGGSNEQRNISKRFDMLSNTDKISQRNTNSHSAGNTALRQAHAITRSEACWKHPTSCNNEFKTKKNSRPARNLRSQRCAKNMRRKRKSHHKWDRWTDWSSCSVTCGRGRQIRWRHCVRNCSNAETEMEEKACQLPACAPGKLFGIFG